MVNVVGLIRTSTIGQVKEGYSLEEQLGEIEKFCTANGFNLIEKFRGGGKSGAKINDDNPARELFNYLGTVTPSAAPDPPVRNPNRMFYKN